ncbi:TerB family tellurite resistance protein [Myxococcota bacterium]|nr:TerB family tellurite resistance protein [Myxococcota bacterium]
MSLLRFLGLGDGKTQASRAGESETVRRIVSRLEELEPEKARYLASFAYVLMRVANADLTIDTSETDKMRHILTTLGGVSEQEAELVVEIAQNQAETAGGTENYIVTREFKKVSTKSQRAELLECLYAVAAADGTISGVESGEIMAIAEEFGFTRPEANSFRSSYRNKLSEFQTTRE